MQKKEKRGKNTISKINEKVDLKSTEVEKILTEELTNINEKLNIFSQEEDKKYNEAIPKVYKDNPAVGTAGLYELYTRISFVCYLREKLVNCPDEIVLHLLLQMWLYALFPRYLSF